MPMPNPSTARPRIWHCEAAMLNPVAPPVALPLTTTRTWALLPLVAAVELGTDVISVGFPIGIPPITTV